MNYIEIKDEFKELLKHTQVLNSLENYKPTENNPVSADYDSLKPEDFIKKPDKKPDTHHRDNLEKGFPTENKPVLDNDLSINGQSGTFPDENNPVSEVRK